MSWQFVLHILKRNGSSTNLFSSYLGSVYDPTLSIYRHTLFVSCSGLWYNSIYSLPTSSWLLCHPYTLHTLQMYPEIFTRKTIPCARLVFCSRCLIISSEKLSSVPSNFSILALFFFLVILGRVNINHTWWIK